jgi:hypothetical protein
MRYSICISGGISLLVGDFEVRGVRGEGEGEETMRNRKGEIIRKEEGV